MFRTKGHFYRAIAGLSLGLGLVLGLLLLVGDGGGQPLKAKLQYLAEGPAGLPQLTLTFDSESLPQRSAAESAFEIYPVLRGEFSWNNTTLIFTSAERLQANTKYQVRLRGGLKLINGTRLSYGETTWEFQTHPGRIIFLRHEGQAVNLWWQTHAGGEAQPLTFETGRQVLDFSVSPGGARVVYSLQETNGLEASLWLVKIPDATGQPSAPTRLMFEPNIKASAPRWSPGGNLIAYERRLVLASGVGPLQLWLITPDGTSLPPLYGGTEQSGYGLSWAARGDKAFFWEPGRKALGIFNFTGEPNWKVLPATFVASLAASPDGREVALGRFDYSGPQERQRILLLTLKNGEWQPDLSQPETVADYNDRQPSWSPNGQLLAFLRRKAGTIFDQLWLFDRQSGKSWPVVSETVFSQGNYDWSPDGSKLVFERYPLQTKPGSKEESEIWEVSQDGKQLQHWVSNAYSPKWLG